MAKLNQYADGGEADDDDDDNDDYAGGGKAGGDDLEKLQDIHEKIREILIENGSEEYGDSIIDEISEAVGISNTNAYYDEDEEYVKPKKVIFKGNASKKDLKKLEEIHEKIREILIENDNEEYGDLVIDQISEVVGIPTTIAYYNDDDEYAEGGEVEDWMEEALASLIEETGYEDLEITYVVDSKIKYEFIASDGDVEYRVFHREGDAEQIAVEQVRDDLQESPENFNQDWLMNYIDGRDFFEEQLNDMNLSYVEDIASESDKKYANRLIAEMVENGILDEDDAQSGNAEELAEYYKDDYIALLTEGQLDEGMNGLQYFIDNFGENETYGMVVDNNLIDIDEASQDAVNIDGIAHFLSSYDGETLYLSDDCVAYRTN
jgi:hypothetical protein